MEPPSYSRVVSGGARAAGGPGESPSASPARGALPLGSAHPRMPAPSIQTTIGFAPPFPLSPRNDAPGGPVNVLVPRSAKKERPAWGLAGPTPPPSAGSSMEGLEAVGATNTGLQPHGIPSGSGVATPWKPPQPGNAWTVSGPTPWKPSPSAWNSNSTPWTGNHGTATTPGTGSTGSTGRSSGTPGTWSRAPSRTVPTPGTASSIASNTGSLVSNCTAFPSPDPDNPWPSNRFSSASASPASPLSPSFLSTPTAAPAFPGAQTPDPDSPFGFLPSYARPAQPGSILQLAVPRSTQTAEKRTIELVCIVQASKAWSTQSGISQQQLTHIRSVFTNFPPPDLDLFPASLSDGTHILGVLPTAFFQMKAALEVEIGGAELQSLAPEKVEVVLSDAEGFRREHPYIPARRFRSSDEYERYVAGFVTGHNRNLQQQRRRHDTYLHSLRHLLFSHLALARQRTSRLLALDIEAWEMDHSVLLEIGYTTAAFRPAPGVGDKGDGVWMTKGHHLVVEENTDKRNGLRVEDNRDGFLFGTTQVLPMKKCLAKLRTALRGADYVIAHAAHSDEKFLRRHGVGFAGKPVLDTQIMVKCLRGTTESLRLSRVLDELGIRNYKGLHNAGNDAYYTMEACLRMGRGPPPPREVARSLGIEWSRVVSREVKREEVKADADLISPTEQRKGNGGQGLGSAVGLQPPDLTAHRPESLRLETGRLDHAGTACVEEVEGDDGHDEDGMEVDG